MAVPGPNEPGVPASLQDYTNPIHSHGKRILSLFQQQHRPQPQGRHRKSAGVHATQKPAPMRRLSSAEAALHQELYGVPSPALVRRASFTESDVVTRLRSNSSRRESMAPPPKMEADDGDKDGEGITRDRSTSFGVADAVELLAKKEDTLFSAQQLLPLQQQEEAQADVQGENGAHDDARVVEEPPPPPPQLQPSLQDGQIGDGRAGDVQEHDVMGQLRDAEVGAGMARGQENDDVFVAREEQRRNGRAHEVGEREEAQVAELVGDDGERAREERGVRVGAAGEVRVQAEVELEEDGDMDGRVEHAPVHADMPLAVLAKEQDLDADVAVQLEMVEEGGGGGKGEPGGVCQRKSADATKAAAAGVGCGNAQRCGSYEAWVGDGQGVGGGCAVTRTGGAQHHRSHDSHTSTPRPTPRTCPRSLSAALERYYCHRRWALAAAGVSVDDGRQLLGLRAVHPPKSPHRHTPRVHRHHQLTHDHNHRNHDRHHQGLLIITTVLPTPTPLDCRCHHHHRHRQTPSPLRPAHPHQDPFCGCAW